jgi:hypothetical protein
LRATHENGRERSIYEAPGDDLEPGINPFDSLGRLLQQFSKDGFR